MPQVCLQRSSVDTFVGERKAARVTQHVRMNLEFDARFFSRPSNQASESRGREWGAAFRHEYPCRLYRTLQYPQGTHFIAEERMSSCITPLYPANVQCGAFELHLRPLQFA